jgi:UDP-glucose 4-epimerase
MDVHGVYTEVLIRWMDAIAAGRPPVIFGDGSDTLDFVHVHDVARANVLAATSLVSDAVFNVGTGIETTLNTLADTLLGIMQSPLRPEYAPPRKVNPVPRRLASVEEAAQHLGFRAQIRLEEGLRSLVNWWQQARLAARQ